MREGAREQGSKESCHPAHISRTDHTDTGEHARAHNTLIHTKRTRTHKQTYTDKCVLYTRTQTREKTCAHTTHKHTKRTRAHKQTYTDIGAQTPARSPYSSQLRPGVSASTSRVPRPVPRRSGAQPCSEITCTHNTRTRVREGRGLVYDLA